MFAKCLQTQSPFLILNLIVWVSQFHLPLIIVCMVGENAPEGMKTLVSLITMFVCVCAWLCLTLSQPHDCSPVGSSVCEIF